MNILHFSNKPVYPKIDGGCVAMAALLDCLLVDGHAIDHVCIATEKHPFSPAAYPKTINLLHSENAKLDTHVTITGALTALVQGINYNLSRFFSQALAEDLKKAIAATNYDLIILDSAFLIGYIDELRKVYAGKIVVRTHNVESDLWEKQRLNASGLKKWYLGRLVKTFRKEELVGLNKADKIWSISKDDTARFLESGVRSPIDTIPVAFPVPEEAPDYSVNAFFHFGSMNWQPNAEALEYLLERIWPKVNGEKTLHIAGSFADSAQSSDPSIHYHGFVKDAQKFMMHHGTLLAPLQSGSGIRIKLLEAMAAGVPCVTTTIGAAGIDHSHQCVAIADTVEEWVGTIATLTGSSEERRALGEKGKAYMRIYHSFEAAIEKMHLSLGK